MKKPLFACGFGLSCLIYLAASNFNKVIFFFIIYKTSFSQYYFFFLKNINIVNGENNMGSTISEIFEINAENL